MARIKKPKLRVKKQETIRQRAEKQLAKSTQPRRKKVATVTKKPFKGAFKILTKEFHPIKISKGKHAELLTSKVTFMPSFFKESFSELKLVKWPTFRQAMSLTFAVIAFSVVIALFVQLLGYGFDKLFKEVILK